MWCYTVDSCVPGDMVTVTGVVKVLNAEEGKYPVKFYFKNHIFQTVLGNKLSIIMTVKQLICNKLTYK